MFNRISEFQIHRSVDGNFANHNARCGRLEIAPTNKKHNLCLIGFRNFRYAALLMGISQIITQDARLTQKSKIYKFEVDLFGHLSEIAFKYSILAK